jgi:hypothetical protein
MSKARIQPSRIQSQKAERGQGMFIDVVDYHGHTVAIDPTRVIKLRPALVQDGDPEDCTLVDFASGGVFAMGVLASVAPKFSPYIRLANLHAPNGLPVLLNADGIAAVVPPNSQRNGNSMAVVKVEFENHRVPSRNTIPLAEDIATTEQILNNAKRS